MGPKRKGVVESDGEGGGPVKKQVKRESVKKSPKSPSSAGANKIVFTGVTEIVPREALEQKVKQAGWQVTSAVSGVTNYLVYGNKLEDGRDFSTGTKYKKAQELLASGKSKAGLKMLSEEDFLEAFPEFSSTVAKKEPVLTQRVSTIPPCDPSSLGHTSPSHTSPAKKVQIDTSLGALRADENTPPKSEALLWAERWRPQNADALAFNEAGYEMLKTWLLTWTPDKKTERACLLAGPPGVGKTTSCHVLGRDTGYIIREFNASDSRGQKQLRNLQGLIEGGASLSRGALVSKQFILFDEADGLSAGDRGGSQELIRLIKISKIPIIATCNDRQHQKLLNSVQSLVLSRQGNTAGSTNKLFFYKDITMSSDLFSAVRRLFTSGPELSPRERLDVFFADYDMVPLIVQENALRNANLNELRKLTEVFSIANRLEKKIRGSMQWDLLPDFGRFSVVLPSLILKSGSPRVDFPKILGKISSSGKVNSIQDGYFELLGDLLVRPLLVSDKSPANRVEECMREVERLELTRDLLVENLMESRLKAAGVPYDKVPTNVKTALTKYVKAAGQPPGELVHKSVSKGKKGTGGKKGAAAKSPAATASPVATQTPTVDVEADDIESDGKTALLREKEEEENRMASIF